MTQLGIISPPLERSTAEANFKVKLKAWVFSTSADNGGKGTVSGGSFLLHPAPEPGGLQALGLKTRTECPLPHPRPADPLPDQHHFNSSLKEHFCSSESFLKT